MTEIVIQTPDDVEKAVPIIVKWAKELRITSAESYAEAGGRLQQIKGMAKRVSDFFSPMKRQADMAKKSILDTEKKYAVPLAEAEMLAKSALRAYDEEQLRLVEAERRRLQAIEDEKVRKEREKAEREAARQRQIEAEARAKAEAARKLAEEASASERKRLLAEAEAAERKAAAAAVKVEAKSEQAARAVATVVQVAVAVPQVAGITRRREWKAEVVGASELLDFICSNRRYDLILVNQKVIDAYAKSAKENAVMPGVRFYPDDTIASRGR